MKLRGTLGQHHCTNTIVPGLIPSLHFPPHAIQVIKGQESVLYLVVVSEGQPKVSSQFKECGKPAKPRPIDALLVQLNFVL